MAQKKEQEVQEQEVQEQELLFEDGPTIAQVEEWKGRFGNIYLTEFEDGDTFVWRALKRKEFKEIMKAEGADSLYREERVSERCVIWPEKYDFVAMTHGKAGVPTFLSEQIMDKSGFSAKVGAIAL